MPTRIAATMALGLPMLALCSCANPTLRMYEGRARPASQIAVLLEPTNSVIICAVDGRQVPAPVNRVELIPGLYIVTTDFHKHLTQYYPGFIKWCKADSPRTASILLVAEAGHRYRLDAEVGTRDDHDLQLASKLRESWWWDLPDGEEAFRWRPKIHDLDGAKQKPEPGPGDEFIEAFLALLARSDRNEDVAEQNSEVTFGGWSMNEKDYENALSHYTRALAVGGAMSMPDGMATEAADTWSYLAIRLWALGYRDDADRCLARALALDSHLPYTWFAKAFILAFTHGKYEEALACIDRALETQSAPQLLCLKHAILMKLDRRSEADAVLAKAKEPAPPVVRVEPAPTVEVTHPVLEEIDRSIANARPVTESTDPKACYEEGVRLLRNGDRTAALAQFDRAILLSPSYAEPWYSKGHILKLEGRLADALVCFEQAVRIKPDSYMAQYARARCLEQMHRDNEAREAYETAAAAGSDSARRWLASHPK